MFNFFRRKRGSTENLDDLTEKMPSENDIRVPDENQNLDNDLIRDNNNRVNVREDTVQKEEVKQEPAPVQKRVRWAEVQTYHDISDNSTQESSSDEDEQVEESESSSEEQDDEEESEDGEDEEDDDNEEEQKDEKEVEVGESTQSEELTRLRSRLESIERDVAAKSSLIHRLQTELREAYQDAEISKFKMSTLQIELDETKKNLELSSSQSDCESEDEEEKRKTDEQLKQCEERIHQLEKELEQVKIEKQRLEISLDSMKNERHQQITTLQKAYEEALKEQDEMMLKFEEDFEELRTLNSRREQQLLEDFEWKLREVEKQCKTRVEIRDKEKDKEISELVCKLADANTQLLEINKLKECRAELEQTKQTNLELKRNLRATNRKLEEVQVNEKVSQEETSRLRIQIDKEKAFTANLQMVHREELDERERKMNFRLDVQKNTINSEWEDRLRRETRQLRLDMDRKAKEEMNEAVEEIKKQMYQRISNMRQEHGAVVAQLQSQIEELKRKMCEKDSNHRETVESLQTQSDAQLMELRRKMEKLYMNYEEKIEKLSEQHEQQISKIQEECDKRIQQVECNFQVQAGTTRATVELVKEQYNRENQARLQQLENQHQRQLEEQWCRMNKDKEEALRLQEIKHKEILEKIQREIDELRNNKKNMRQQRENSDTKQIQSVNDDLEKLSQINTIGTYNQSADRSNAQQSFREELGEAEANLVREKGRLQDLTLKAKMCQTIQQLTLQLEASKKEIESLHSQLGLDSGSRQRNLQSRQPVQFNDKFTPPLPTAKVEPQTSPVPLGKIESRVSSRPTGKGESHSSPKPVGKVEQRTSPITVGKLDRQTTTVPTANVQPRCDQQQSYNQSRRSRKHRSRRH